LACVPASLFALFFCLQLSLALPVGTNVSRQQVRIALEGKLTPKLAYGIARLVGALQEAGIPYQATRASSTKWKGQVIKIVVDPRALPRELQRAESFSVKSSPNETQLTGFDDAGALYACGELASRIRAAKLLPKNLTLAETPKMSLRGVPLFLMTAGSYDYPITEHEFPWFYDKSLWIRTLDFLAAQRFNFISLWNSHPFPYFMKLTSYPEVRVLSESELERNVALLEWLSREAEKRNIWLIFHFYNIHVPESFALAHGIPKNPSVNGYVLSEPNPLVADYTRYCIREFVGKYPSVGLYFPLGEALQKGKSSWMNDVLLAGVKDTGKHPPVILRQHELVGLTVLENALANYDNLYTEMKHNDEMLAAPQPNPDNAEWIQRSRRHIINVHLVGNLKPFRWASPTFIRETASAQQRMGAQGVQVYPLWVWYWPYSADSQRLFQIDRDWLWYAAWGRYAWDADRPTEQEEEYWTQKIAGRFGANAATYILAAYDSAGKAMPSIPRLFWFDGWNHWFASNGLMLDQILRGTPIPYTNVQRILSVKDYAQSLAEGRLVSHEVLTPTALTTEMVSDARRAVELCNKAQPLVEKNGDEFSRLRTDFEATLLIAQFYQAKVDASVHYVAYQMSRNPAEGGMVIDLLGRSLEFYRELVRKTDKAYPTANDISNDIPFPFHPPTGIAPPQANSFPRLAHWRDILPVFEAEFQLYRSLLEVRETAGK
jgi:hypothetical protein